MQKSTLYLTISLALFLTAGCARPADPIVTAALFCDIEQPRRFTQRELDWRAEHAPWNLRKDYQTNLAWERECQNEVNNANTQEY